MHQGSIIRHTEHVAKELKRRFKGNPGLELSAWLRVAHQREAMVTRIYGLPELRQRLPEEAEGGAAGIAAKAIKRIWAQETSHTAFLGAVRLASGDPTPQLEEIQGKFEGDVTRAGASGNPFARLVIAVGAFLDIVPDFAKEIDAMSLLEFFQFCGELEATARQGYERMIELSKLPATKGADDSPVFELTYEFTKILLEERYHASVFDCVALWLESDGRSFRSLPQKDCVAALHALASEHLDLAVAKPILASRPGSRGHIAQISSRAHNKTDRWISDGGLDSLFAEFGLGAPVAHLNETVTAMTPTPSGG